MRRLTALLLFALAMPLAAQSPDEIAFKFHLELAKAKAKPTAVARELLPAPTERLTYADGYREALATGKPLLVRVGNFPCEPVCTHCKACLRSDTAECFGDSTPRLILAIPAGDKLTFAREWTAAPTIDAVQAEVKARKAVSQSASPFLSADGERSLPVGSGK